MTANAASATSAARVCSEPNCSDARAGLRAWVRVGSVSGVGRVIVDRAVCDHALALVGVLEERGNGTEQQGKRDKVERKKEGTYFPAPSTPSDTQLVAFFDLTWAQAHYEEVFCLFEELAGKDYDRFRTAADLGSEGRSAGTGREREKKTHSEACCDCDALTNSLTAK